MLSFTDPELTDSELSASGKREGSTAKQAIVAPGGVEAPVLPQTPQQTPAYDSSHKPQFTSPNSRVVPFNLDEQTLRSPEQNGVVGRLGEAANSIADGGTSAVVAKLDPIKSPSAIELSSKDPALVLEMKRKQFLAHSDGRKDFPDGHSWDTNKVILESTAYLHLYRFTGPQCVASEDV